MVFSGLLYVGKVCITPHHSFNQRTVLFCCLLKHSKGTQRIRTAGHSYCTSPGALLCLHNAPSRSDAEKLHLLNDLIPSHACGMTFIINTLRGPTGSAAVFWVLSCLVTVNIIHPRLKPADVFISYRFQLGVAAGAFVCLCV